jgi:hypothetical protein
MDNYYLICDLVNTMPHAQAHTHLHARTLAPADSRMYNLLVELARDPRQNSVPSYALSLTTENPYFVGGHVDTPAIRAS